MPSRLTLFKVIFFIACFFLINAINGTSPSAVLSNIKEMLDFLLSSGVFLD